MKRKRVKISQYRLNRTLKAIGQDPDIPGGVAADAAEYAALRDLVAEVADEIGVPAPAHVRLGPYGEVVIKGRAATGLTLLVGAPFVIALAAADLKIVLAHTMALFTEDEPTLSDGLRRIGGFLDEVLPGPVDEPPRGRFARSRQKVADQMRGLDHEIEQKSDRAAATVARSDAEALTALVRAQALSEHFADFAWRFASVESVAGVYDRWLEVLTGPVPPWPVHGAPVYGGGSGRDKHPGLSEASGEAMRALAPPVRLVAERESAIVARIAPGDAAGLAAQLDVDLDMVAQLYGASSEQDILRCARSVLSRAATMPELLQAIEDGRGAELVSAWHAEAVREVTGSRQHLPLTEVTNLTLNGATPALGTLLVALVAAAGVRRGYRYDPLLRPGRLVKDHADDLDLFAMVENALAATPTDVTEIRAFIESR